MNQIEILSLLKKTPVAQAITVKTGNKGVDDLLARVDTGLRVERKLAVVEAESAELLNETVAPVPVTVIETADSITVTETAPLCDEGYPWDSRIHASTKTKVKSQIVKGGLTWRGKKGVAPDLAEIVRNEIHTPIDDAPGIPAEPAEPVTPVTPVDDALGTPPAPPTPAAPVILTDIPAIPAAPAAPVVDNARQESVVLVHELTNVIGVEYLDVMAMFKTEFGSADGFETLTPDQDGAVRDRLKDLVSQYKDLSALVCDINEWAETVADGGYKDSVTEQFKIMFEQYNAGKLVDIHYSDLQALKPQLEGYHASWAALGNK